MLEIKTKEVEVYDEDRGVFIKVPSCILTLEHSLMSVAKWEAKWHVPYLSSAPRTLEQEVDYIRCMVVGKPPSDVVLNSLSEEDIRKIRDYIEDPYTATVISQKAATAKRDTITVEQIYHRMFENNIPMDCQKWHLNRLLTLIRVCNIYNSGKSNKMSKADAAKRNAELNAARRAKYNTRG